MRVAILGTGHMGTAVGLRLLAKGHEVVAWNRSLEKTRKLQDRGAHVVPTAQAAAAECDVACLLLTDDSAVMSVASDGVMGALQPTARLVDMSTVSPQTSRRVGGMTPGQRFVDAPILGGPAATEAGKASLLLGGDQELVQGLDGLWSDIAVAYYYCGPTGAGTTLKLLSNLMLVGGTALLAEAVATAQANGVPDDILRSALRPSPAIAPGVAARFEDVVAGGHDGWWTIRLADKDMSLAMALATDHGLTLPVAEAARRLVQQAAHAGYCDKDLGSVIEPIRRADRAEGP